MGFLGSLLPVEFRNKGIFFNVVGIILFVRDQDKKIKTKKQAANKIGRLFFVPLHLKGR